MILHDSSIVAQVCSRFKPRDRRIDSVSSSCLATGNRHRVGRIFILLNNETVRPYTPHRLLISIQLIVIVYLWVIGRFSNERASCVSTSNVYIEAHYGAGSSTRASADPDFGGARLTSAESCFGRARARNIRNQFSAERTGAVNGARARVRRRRRRRRRLAGWLAGSARVSRAERARRTFPRLSPASERRPARRPAETARPGACASPPYRYTNNYGVMSARPDRARPQTAAAATATATAAARRHFPTHFRNATGPRASRSRAARVTNQAGGPA